MPNHRVVGSDHISKLTADGGFVHWQTVWQANPRLRSARHNPNLLFHGDRDHHGDDVEVPRPGSREVSAATGGRHTFVLRSDRLFLRLRVLKADFSAQANVPYSLTVDTEPNPFSGNTDGNGQIEVEIQRTAQSGTLTVRIPATDTDRAGGTPPPANAVRGPVPVTWQLRIGALDPILENAPDRFCTAGVQQRLNNLGYRTGPVDGVHGDTTDGAIRNFQTTFSLGVDGVAGQRETQPKLRDVHDTPDSILGPATASTPAPPGTSGRTQIMDTPDGDIGHVAPDFDDRRHFNTLRVRPRYRVSLSLGAIDDLCPDATASDAGRRMRMQLLGYLYERLNSPNIAAAFGKAWSWFTTELGKNDADLDRELGGIVEGNALPAPGSQTRIFLPGSYCYDNNDVGVALGGPFPSPSANYSREQAVLNDNAVLGAIPIIAKVEQYSDASGDWSPAPNVTVYLQLQAPDAPAGTAAAPAARNTATATPPTALAQPGPAGYVTSHVANPNGATPLTGGDPQVDNCHSVVGGLRGLPVAGNALELTVAGAPRGGFYAAHPARAISGRPPFFNAPAAAVVIGTSHANAIQATSNANGEAGFILRPRQAGDRYKLRAYVGPATLPSDGTDPAAVMCETGTLVIWRRMRIAKYLQWPYPGGWTAPATPPHPPGSLVRGMQGRILNMQNITLANVAAEYRKAYCDMIIESTAALHQLTAAEWTAARNHAATHVTAPGIDMTVMLPTTNTTPFLFPLATYAQYNAGVAGHPPFIPFTNINVYWAQVSSLLNQLIDWFVDYFSGNALPFVVMQSPFGDSLTYSGTVPGGYNGGFLTTSGQATSARGCHLWWGQWFYSHFTYSLDANTAHETGHCHYGPHQWTLPGPPLSGGFPTEHDRHDRCIMSYLAMPGDFCGRCLLRLRGWDISAIPAN